MASAKAFETIARGAAEAAAEREPTPETIPDDPWVFVRDCVWTIDEHTKQIAPLIAESEREGSYLEFLTRQWQRGGRQQWKKSRQIRVTWLLSALHLWAALRQPGVRIGYQGQKFDDVDAYLQQRFWFIYEHIPTKYVKPRARYISGMIEVYHDAKATVPTSFIHGLAEGADQVRQYTFTYLWMDESAFHVDQKETHGAAKPTLDGGGSILKTSSSGGSRVFFYQLAEEDVAPGPVTTKHEVFTGITAWQRNGFDHLFIHYSADPRKRHPMGDIWIAQAKEGQPTDQWQREMEGDDSIEPGLPVFCDTDRIRVVEQWYRSDLRFFGGFDPGFLWPFWYDFQVETLDTGGEILHYLHEHVKPNTEVYTFGVWVKAERERLYGKRQWTDYGDDAANQRKETGQVAAVLRSQGFTIITKPTGPGGVLKGTVLAQRFISAGCIEIDPQCKFLITAIKSGHIRGDDGQPLTGDKGHPYCDAIQAALQYPLQNIFDYEYQPRGQRVISGVDMPTVQPVPAHHDANAHPASENLLTTGRVYGGNRPMQQPAVHTDRVYAPPATYDPMESIRNRRRR